MTFFDEIQRTKDPFILQLDPDIHVEYPRFIEKPDHTHLVMKEVRYNHIIRNLMVQLPELKVIGLVRHPCAVIDSWIHAPREFKPEWSIEDQWRSGSLKNQGRPEEFFGFDKWKEVAELFLDLEAQDPERMKVVRYADINADPIGAVKDIFTYCDLEFGPGTEAFIHASQSREGGDANSIYRKPRLDDTWKSRLPQHIVDQILEDVADGPLVRFL